MSAFTQDPTPPPPDLDEDPYQVYMLRRPAERSSSIVPQLAKQPEMAETRLRYRRIPPEARSGSLGTLGKHFPPRFEFPNRRSLLESLTSDDESSSFAVRKRKDEKRKKKKKKKVIGTVKRNDIVLFQEPVAVVGEEEGDVSGSPTSMGDGDHKVLALPEEHAPIGLVLGKKEVKRTVSVPLGKGIVGNFEGRPICAPEAMSPSMRQGFVLKVEEPVVYPKREDVSRKGRKKKLKKKKEQVVEGGDFERDRELSVSFANRRYTAEEAATKPLNALQRLFQAMQWAKMGGFGRGARR